MAGNARGFGPLRRSALVVYDSENTSEIPENNITNLQVGRDGSLWIGTFRGRLIRFIEGKFTTYPELDGYSLTKIGAIFDVASTASPIASPKSSLKRAT